MVGLFFSAEGHPLLLQFKEAARASELVCGHVGWTLARETARDHAALAAAVKRRRIEALVEEYL